MIFDSDRAVKRRRLTRMLGHGALAVLTLSLAVANRGVAMAEPAVAPANDEIPPAMQAVLDAEAAREQVVQKVYGTVVAIYGNNRAGGGSGVLIDPEGYVVTNYHVVAAAGANGWAGLADGKLYRWNLLGIDPGGDLAMIKLDGRKDFPAARFGDSDYVRVGEWVMAMGNPFALAEDQRPTVTLGIVSGINRFQRGTGPLKQMLVYGNCIQIDSSINPGNSGGPLFNMLGQVIGINGRGSFEERGRVNVGIGYAISAEQVKNLIPDLLATRTAMHGTLDATFTQREPGVVICESVNMDSPIGKAGMRPGDRLVSVDSVRIRSANHFASIITIYPANWPVDVAWEGRGGLQHATVRLTPLPFAPPQPARPATTPKPKPGMVPATQPKPTDKPADAASPQTKPSNEAPAEDDQSQDAESPFEKPKAEEAKAEESEGKPDKAEDANGTPASGESKVLEPQDGSSDAPRKIEVGKPVEVPLPRPAIPRPANPVAAPTATPGEIRDVKIAEREGERLLKSWKALQGAIKSKPNRLEMVARVIDGGRDVGESRLYVDVSRRGAEIALADMGERTQRSIGGLLEEFAGGWPVLLHPADWKKMKLLGGDRAAGERAYRIQVTDNAGEHWILWLSVLAEDNLRLETRLIKFAPADAAGVASDLAVVLGDYRVVSGMRLPFEYRVVRGAAEESLVEFKVSAVNEGDAAVPESITSPEASKTEPAEHAE